jgi:RNA polymerase-binding transcription factor DksA
MKTMKLGQGRSEALRGLLQSLRSEAVAEARRAGSLRAGTEKPARVSLDGAIEARDRIGLIDEALERVARNMYGFCEQCGEEIPLERLARLPFNPYCSNCEEKEKRGPAVLTPHQQHKSGRRKTDSPRTTRKLNSTVRGHRR